MRCASPPSLRPNFHINASGNHRPFAGALFAKFDHQPIRTVEQPHGASGNRGAIVSGSRRSANHQLCTDVCDAPLLFDAAAATGHRDASTYAVLEHAGFGMRAAFGRMLDSYPEARMRDKQLIR